MNSVQDSVCRNTNGNDLFAFNHIDDHYVLKQIKSFSKNKVCGVDDICSKLLKSCAEKIASPLTYLVNFSLASGGKEPEFALSLKGEKWMNRVTIGQCPSCLYYPKLLKEQSLINYIHSLIHPT